MERERDWVERDALGRRNIYFMMSDLPRYRQLEVRAEYWMRVWWDQEPWPLPTGPGNVQAARAAAGDFSEAARHRG